MSVPFTPFIYHIAVPSLLFIKGCISINGQLCIGSILDWECQHLVFYYTLLHALHTNLADTQPEGVGRFGWPLSRQAFMNALRG